MKFCLFAFLVLGINFALWGADDYQQTSDEGQNEVSRTSMIIKESLRKAINENDDLESIKQKMRLFPAEYDLATIQADWDEELADLKAGRFCNGCGKSKKEIGPDFEAHITRVAQGTSPASPEAYVAVNNKYQLKVDFANDGLRKNELARRNRASYVSQATSYATYMHNKIQLSYDFQMKVYFPIKLEAKQVLFKTMGDTLLAQDLKVQQALPTDSAYKDYVYQRFSTTEKMDSSLTKLNEKRLQLIKAAEAKKTASLDLIATIIELAARTGDLEMPPASETIMFLSYTPFRDVYYSVRSNERIESLLSPEALGLYKKVKEEW